MNTRKIPSREKAIKEMQKEKVIKDLTKDMELLLNLFGNRLVDRVHRNMAGNVMDHIGEALELIESIE